MKNALVLGAGGVAGAFQAGALSVLLKEKEYAPQGIFGSSAGALNGAFLADRAGKCSGPVDWASISEELVNFWRTEITDDKKIWIKGGNAGDGFRGEYQTQANPPGPPQNPPLFWDIVRDQIKQQNLIAAERKGVHYSAGAVDLFEGDIWYPELSDPNVVDFVEFIIASTAVPIVFDSVDIKRENQIHSFVDGGTRDVAPVSRAIKQNYENIACIVCQPRDLERVAPGYNPRDPDLDPLVGRLFTIIINETVNNDLLTIDLLKALLPTTRLETIDKKLHASLLRYHQLRCATVIRPEKGMKTVEVDDFGFGPQDIAEMINEGVHAATSLLEKRKVFSTAKQAFDENEDSFIVCWDSSKQAC